MKPFGSEKSNRENNRMQSEVINKPQKEKKVAGVVVLYNPDKKVLENINSFINQVEKLFKAILDTNSSVECACHFHNTYGMGIANAYAAMKVGVQNYESSIAGLGGCPFTKIAGANLCTEDFVHMLHRMNLRRDVNLLKLIEAAKDVARFFAREMSGSVHKTGPIPERETVH